MKSKQIHQGIWGKSIFLHGKWYMLSSILTKGINMIVLRIYTEYLSPLEYGILDTLNAVALLLPFFISLYLDSAFGRFYHEYKDNKNQLRELFSTIFLFVFGFGSLVTVLVIGTSKFWVDDLLEIPIYPHIFLAFIPPLFLQLGNLGLVFLRQSLLSKETSFVEIVRLLINLLVALPLLILADFGILAKLWGTFISAVAIFIFYVFYFKHKRLLTLTFNKKILKDSLVYSIPLLPGFLGMWLAGLSDRLVIAKYTGIEQVGYYAVGFMLGKLMYIFHDALTQVISPITMSGLIHDNSSSKKKMVTLSEYIWIYMLLLNFLIFCFSAELIQIFAENSYRQAAQVIPIIGFSYVLGSQSRIFSNVIMYHKKNWILSSGGIIQGVMNLALNILFVPVFGYIFAAISTVLSVLIYTLWIVYWALRIDDLKFNFNAYLASFSMFSLGILFIHYGAISSFWIKLCITIPILFIIYLKKPVHQI